MAEGKGKREGAVRYGHAVLCLVGIVGLGSGAKRGRASQHQERDVTNKTQKRKKRKKGEKKCLFLSLRKGGDDGRHGSIFSLLLRVFE